MNACYKVCTTAALVGLMMSTAAAAGLAGSKWQTVDEKTGEKKAVVQFSSQGSAVSGKIISVNNPAHANQKCSKCSGNLKDKPIVGLPIISGLKADGSNKWTGGSLVDPETGKTYKGQVTLSADGKKLELRGYVGAPVFGRSQTWTRVN